MDDTALAGRVGAEMARAHGLPILDVTAPGDDAVRQGMGPMLMWCVVLV